MNKRCPDCNAKNLSYREYCVRCGGKLTRSHRSLHLMNSGRQSRFILDRAVR